MRPVPTFVAVLASAGHLLSGCEASGPSVPFGSVRDSAGIRIVEHFGIPDSLPIWTLDSVPSVSIGSAEGGGPSSFGRVTAMAQRADGVIVVGDELAHEIRAFTPDGAHLWTAGGEGEGPGELDDIVSLLILPGDSVLVVGEGVADVFDANGRFGRRLEFERPQDTIGAATITGIVGGRIVGWTMLRREGAPPEGIYRFTSAQLFFDMNGALAARGMELPGPEWFGRSIPGGGYATGNHPMGRRTQMSAMGEGVIVTSQDRFEIVRTGTDGVVEAMLRVAAPSIAIDDVAIARLTEAGKARNDGLYPPSFPAINRIRLDSSGRTWVQEFLPPYETRSAKWWVFDGDSQFAAEVAIPQGFVVDHIQDGQVLGIAQDELEVQYVQLGAIR